MTHDGPRIGSWSLLSAGLLGLTGAFLAAHGVGDILEAKSTFSEAPRLESGDTWTVEAPLRGLYTLFREAPSQSGERRRVAELRPTAVDAIELTDGDLGLTVYPERGLTGLSWEHDGQVATSVMTWRIDQPGTYHVALGGPAGQRYLLVADAANLLDDADQGVSQAAAGGLAVLTALLVLWFATRSRTMTFRRPRPYLPQDTLVPARPVAREGVVAVPYDDVAPRYAARKTVSGPVLPAPPEGVAQERLPPAWEQVWEEPSLDHTA